MLAVNDCEGLELADCVLVWDWLAEPDWDAVTVTVELLLCVGVDDCDGLELAGCVLVWDWLAEPDWDAVTVTVELLLCVGVSVVLKD
jgi:hypothetical protein